MLQTIKKVVRKAEFTVYHEAFSEALCTVWRAVIHNYYYWTKSKDPTRTTTPTTRGGECGQAAVWYVHVCKPLQVSQQKRDVAAPAGSSTERMLGVRELGLEMYIFF